MERLADSHTVPGVTPQQCFDYLVEPSNATAWASFLESVESHGPPDVGRTLEARVRFLGLRFPVAVDVTCWDEPHRYVLGADTRASGSLAGVRRRQSPLRIQIGADLTADADATRVDAFLTVDPGSFLPLPGFVVRRGLRRLFERDVASLADHLAQLG